MPAVVLVSGQFETLAKTIMKSQDVDESIAILIANNPECIQEEELTIVAHRVLLAAVDRLSGTR
jgi:hypothetical protein